MKDYLTIKEFSKLSGLEETTLRYWDDIGLFSPARRNPENNYRYYTPEQIMVVNFITVLSNLNVQLKTISKLGKKRTPDNIIDLIENQETQFDLDMNKLKDSYSIMHARRELISYALKLEKGYRAVNGRRVDFDKSAKEGVWVDENTISILHKRKTSIIIGPRNNKEKGKPFYENFIKFCDKSNELRLNLNYPIGEIHDSFESFLEMPGAPDYYFSMDPSGNSSNKEGNYLVGFQRGYYGEFSDLPERMEKYIAENSLKPRGPVYTIYLVDEVCETDPNRYLAQVCVAV